MSDLDNLMNLDPCDMTSEDIAAVVNHHRKQRQLIAQGVKPKKDTGPKTDISAIMNRLSVKLSGDLPAPAPTVKRRI